MMSTYKDIEGYSDLNIEQKLLVRDVCAFLDYVNYLFKPELIAKSAKLRDCMVSSYAEAGLKMKIDLSPNPTTNEASVLFEVSDNHDCSVSITLCYDDKKLVLI